MILVKECNITTAQQQQKEIYDQKHLHSELSEGTKASINIIILYDPCMQVLVENTVQKQRKEGKLEDLWLGPHTIYKHLGKEIYQVANNDGRILKKKVNINRLKSICGEVWCCIMTHSSLACSGEESGDTEDDSLAQLTDLQAEVWFEWYWTWSVVEWQSR